MGKQWRDRMLASTRGKVLSLLRWGPRTVNELADELGLTDNAVRLHLSGLERDGLIQQEGVRRGASKPSNIYRLSSEAESFFPKAYATVLTEVLGFVREQQGEAGLETFLRSVGRRAGERARAGSPELRARVDAAVALLSELGGLAEVKQDEEGFLIQGYSCPLAAIVGSNPEACALAEELISGVVGAPVHECCDRTNSPRCSFRVSSQNE